NKTEVMLPCNRRQHRGIRSGLLCDIVVGGKPTGTLGTAKTLEHLHLCQFSAVACVLCRKAVGFPMSIHNAKRFEGLIANKFPCLLYLSPRDTNRPKCVFSNVTRTTRFIKSLHT